MSNLKIACPVADLPPNTVRLCNVEGLELAVYNVAGDVYASQDACSHGSTSLADGELDGYQIECPLHQGRFDVRTGAPMALPCIKSIKVYQTLISDGQVFVDLGDLT